MRDNEYIYDSRDLAKTTIKTHKEIIDDIRDIANASTYGYNQFLLSCHYDSRDGTTLYYKMTQNGYDLLQNLWISRKIWNAAKTMVYTDKNGNTIADWSDFKHKILEPESNITFEPLKKYQPTGGNNIMEFNGTITASAAYQSLAQPSNAPVAKSAPTEPRCKELVELWYGKSKGNIYTATNAKCKELLKKDSLTQKIIQSLQTIRVLWGTDHPGDDNERQEQYRKGPGYYFESWMEDYNLWTNSDMNNAFRANYPFWVTGCFNRLTCTTATEKLLKSLEEKSKQLLEDLDTKRAEILLQINAADTYEQEIQILKVYEVLDTNGIISPVPADEITIPLTSEE